jgi:hypothetical protein
MATYEFITGEIVQVEADSEEQALELLGEGEYEFIEVQTELRAVR